MDIVHKVVDHLLESLNEVDNKTPSSARPNGVFVLVVVMTLQVMIVGVICWEILKLDPALVG